MLRTRSSVRLTDLLPPDFARENIIAVAVLDNRPAIDDYGFYSGGMFFHFLSIDDVRQLLAHQVIDLVGVKNGNVGRHSFFQQAAV
jgi:hypothetical protein